MSGTPPRIPRPRICFLYRLPRFPLSLFAEGQPPVRPLAPFGPWAHPSAATGPAKGRTRRIGAYGGRSGIRPPLAAALDTRAPRAAHGRHAAGGARIHDPMRTSGAAGSRHGVRRPANAPHMAPPEAPAGIFTPRGVLRPWRGMVARHSPQKDPRRGLHAPQRHPF